MNDIAKLADYAADKSDRYLFILALLVLGVVALLVWRWIVADRDKISARLTEVTDRHIQSQEKLTEVVNNNTHALREVKEVMAYCRSKTQFPNLHQ